MRVVGFAVERLRNFLALALAIALLGAAALAGPAKAELWYERIEWTADQLSQLASFPADPAPLEAAMLNAVLQECNAARARHGLNPLTPDPALAQIANAYSEDMLWRNFFGHVDPNGRGLADRIPRNVSSRFSNIGENLWTGEGDLDWTVESLSRHAARNWMESPSHRDALLDPQYVYTGIGVAIANRKVYVTMLFGRPHNRNRPRMLVADLYPPEVVGGSTPVRGREVLPAPTRARAPAPAIAFADPEPPAAFDLAESRTALSQGLNAVRLAGGLRRFQISAGLSEAAQAYAERQLAAHLSGAAASGEPSAADMAMRRSEVPLRAARAAMWTAENGLGDSQAVADRALTAFQNNAISAESLSDADYSVMGVGLARQGDVAYAVTLYGAVSDAPAPQPAPPAFFAEAEPVFTPFDGRNLQVQFFDLSAVSPSFDLSPIAAEAAFSETAAAHVGVMPHSDLVLEALNMALAAPNATVHQITEYQFTRGPVAQEAAPLILYAPFAPASSTEFSISLE